MDLGVLAAKNRSLEGKIHETSRPLGSLPTVKVRSPIPRQGFLLASREGHL